MRNKWDRVCIGVAIFLGVLLLQGCGVQSSKTEKLLCEQAYSAEVEQGVPKEPFLMLERKDWENKDWETYTSPFASNPKTQEAATLVCIRQSRVDTGNLYYYEGNKDLEPEDVTAYQLKWDIRIVLLSDRKVVAADGFLGHMPLTEFRSASPYHLDIYGDPPVEYLIDRIMPGRIFIADHKIQDIAFSPDGHSLASTGNLPDYRELRSLDTYLQMWEVTTGEETTTFAHPEWGSCVEFSPDGKALATCSADVLVWDTSSGDLTHAIEIKGDSHGLAYSPDGKFLAGTSDYPERVLLWDGVNGEEVGSYLLEDIYSDFYAIDFSPDGNKLAVGVRDNILILDPLTMKIIQTLNYGDPNWNMSDVVFSPDGQRLAGYGTALWDTSTFQKVLTIENGLDLAFSPDGLLLAQGDCDGGVEIWDIHTGEKINILHGLSEDACVRAVVFSPDGKWLAAADGENDFIYLWAMEEIKP